MDTLDTDAAYQDERAVAQLIRAVLDVLGGQHHGGPPLAEAVPLLVATHGIRTPAGEDLMLNKEAKLEIGCTVAVFLEGNFFLVGRIIRRPTLYRKLLIAARMVDGTEGICRIFGLRDKDTDFVRVVGVMRRLPFDDEPD